VALGYSCQYGRTNVEVVLRTVEVVVIAAAADPIDLRCRE
jgi:hypothetical protein